MNPILFSFLFLLSGCASNIALNQTYDVSRVRKIALLNFSGLEKHPNIGIIVTNEFNFAFLKHGFSIVERNYIDHVLAEQNLASTGAIEINEIKKLGTILGIDSIVIGFVERFKPEKSEEISYSLVPPPDPTIRKISSYSLGNSASAVEVARAVRFDLASISVNFRMIDVETGEVIAVGSDSTEADTATLATKSLALKMAKNLRNDFNRLLLRKRK